MTESYDFTKFRLGSYGGPHRRKIVKCPKCGRKGTDDGILRGKTVSSGMVTHKGELVEVAGIAFFSTKDWCSYPVPHDPVGEREQKERAA